MSLKLYNTLTRKKEPFAPIDPKNVRMYVCGPTVYDFAHIGNARPIIVFDVLFRLLRHIYGEKHVTYVRNITDVDDKINARAAERYPDLPPEVGIRRLTEETEAQFKKDIAPLGVLDPTHEPRATEHIQEMVALCEALVARGHAYVAEDHVLFDVPSMSDYGRLSNRSLEDMEAGARVEVAPYKKGPMDFVLWKPSKPGEPAWPSPKGVAAKGRPGWHIECSAMADKWLWDEPRLKGALSDRGLARPHQFDIHGGGIDLVFPHHENEIAQSRCAHGASSMATVWMHNGFLQVEGEKMSKSLGNFVTINELLGKTLGEVVRIQMLKTHYRQPIDWTTHNTGVAQLDLIKFGRFLGGPNAWRPMSQYLDDRFIAALSDDLNTPLAISVLHTICEEFARSPNADKSQQDRLDAVFNGLSLLGIDGLDDFEHRLSDFNRRKSNLTNDMVAPLIAARLDARKRKDFAEGDRIRDELAKMGVALKDTKNKDTGEIETTWDVVG